MANIPLVFAGGASVTNSAASIGTSKVVGIQMPSLWTAAPLSFLASYDGVNFFSLFRNGNEFVEPVTASTFAKLSSGDFSGVSYIKVQSGSVTNGLINQPATTTIVLVTQ